MTAEKHLLEIKGLTTRFFTQQGVAPAVSNLSFSLNAGEVLGVVGESGSGKSVTAQSILRLIPDPPGRIVAGEILFGGLDLAKASKKQLRAIRGDRISMIFQEPMTSLNPVKSIGRQIAEVFSTHLGTDRKESIARAEAMLKKVQISEPKRRIREFPHQLSGGMRQRVMIAMALACAPEILLADEPTTALDVTVQAQIIDLMLKLQEKEGTAIMMITHDLGVIAEVAHRVIVMYAGRIVEMAPVNELFDNALHPYTAGLIKSVPRIGLKKAGDESRLQEIHGMVPSLYNLPVGCCFYDRCPVRMDRCTKELPPLINGGLNHQVRCWLHE